MDLLQSLMAGRTTKTATPLRREVQASDLRTEVYAALDQARKAAGTTMQASPLVYWAANISRTKVGAKNAAANQVRTSLSR